MTQAPDSPAGLQDLASSPSAPDVTIGTLKKKPSTRVIKLKKGHPQGRKIDLTKEERRAKLMLYLENGIRNQSELAKLIGVHRNTIGADIIWLRGQDRDRITRGDAHEILGETDRVLEEIEQKARDTYQAAAKDPKLRSDLLKIERDTRIQRIELMFKTGAIPRIKDTDEFLVAQEFRSMTSEQLKERARTIMTKFEDVLRPPGAPKFRTPGESKRYEEKARALADGELISMEPLPKEEVAEVAEKFFTKAPEVQGASRVNQNDQQDGAVTAPEPEDP